MPTKCHSLDEFILNVSQLTNTGKEYYLYVFRTTDKRQIKGILRGIRPTGRMHLLFYGGDTLNSQQMYRTISMRDIEGIGEIRFLLRQMLLYGGWRRVATSDGARI